MLTNGTIQAKVISADGTPLVYTQTGNGSPLLLVHGTGADHTRWAAVLLQLAQHFTVYFMDRRGHGDCGDCEVYSIQREYEDIVSVAEAMDGPADVLGHSFGAASVLGATPSIPNLCRLIPYEPPMLHEQQTRQHTKLSQRMDQALAQGDHETVVLTLLTEMQGVSRSCSPSPSCVKRPPGSVNGQQHAPDLFAQKVARFLEA